MCMEIGLIYKNKEINEININWKDYYYHKLKFEKIS